MKTVESLCFPARVKLAFIRRVFESRGTRSHLALVLIVPEKKDIVLLAVLIIFRNCGKIMLLSENYVLCHQNYAT